MFIKYKVYRTLYVCLKHYDRMDYAIFLSVKCDLISLILFPSPHGATLGTYRSILNSKFISEEPYPNFHHLRLSKKNVVTRPESLYLVVRSARRDFIGPDGIGDPFTCPRYPLAVRSANKMNKRNEIR